MSREQLSENTVNEGGSSADTDARLTQACSPDVHGWQPIETAPKDEMFIYYEPRDGKRCIGLAYHAVSGWRDSEGDWSRRLNPTHWMPLPKPPARGKLT